MVNLPAEGEYIIQYFVENKLSQQKTIMNAWVLPQEAILEYYEGISIKWFLDSNYTIEATANMNIEQYIISIDSNYTLPLYGKFQIKYLDQKGVKYLWSKISMQDYPNNETLASVINAIDETKADKSELIQSDWNQTDEIAKDFIKNKPDIASDEDIMNMLSDLDIINPITISDGSILISPTGEIYSL